MKKFLVMICLTVFAVTYASAQSGKKPMIVQDPKQAKVDTKSRGAKIKMDKPTSDVVTKAAERGTGVYCTINFDNYTGYWVNIYVDGNYYGDMAPWDNKEITVYAGYTTYYCVTAGGTYEWSGDGGCDGNYHINLR